jgi:hypothetical protein
VSLTSTSTKKWSSIQEPLRMISSPEIETLDTSTRLLRSLATAGIICSSFMLRILAWHGLHLRRNAEDGAGRWTQAAHVIELCFSCAYTSSLHRTSSSPRQVPLHLPTCTTAVAVVNTAALIRHDPPYTSETLRSPSTQHPGSASLSNFSICLGSEFEHHSAAKTPRRSRKASHEQLQPVR